MQTVYIVAQYWSDDTSRYAPIWVFKTREAAQARCDRINEKKGKNALYFAIVDELDYTDE